MTLISPFTLTNDCQVKKISSSLKMMLPDVLHCCSGYSKCTEFLQKYSESSFSDGSGLIFISV
jgi:hypothetical protein